jgi:hypothetical protein
VKREAYLDICARLARHARKAELVGSFIFASRACRARLACLARSSRAADSENGLFEHLAGAFLFPTLRKRCRMPKPSAFSIVYRSVPV